MADLLPFAVIGLVTGAVYGLAGVGLVLTYKTSGVLNFAHGALAAVAAYAFYSLNVENQVAWPVAAAISIFAVGPILGLLFERLAAGLAGKSLPLQIACTVGVLLVIEAAIVLTYGSSRARTVPVFLARGAEVKLLGTVVEWAQIITFLVAVAATAALAISFHRTRRGVAMRAVVDNPELLGLAGTSPTSVRRLAWIIGCTFAAGSGVLFSTLIPLDPVGLTFLVVAAFGAAAIGAFDSLPVTFAGGLLIGLLAALSSTWFPTGLLSGLAAALPFVVLFAVLLVFPRRRLAPRAYFVPRSRPTWTAPPALQIGGAALLLGALALVPSFAGIRLTAWTAGVAYVIVFLSLSLLVRTSGQVSLGHIAFIAIGAAAFSHLSREVGMPWPVALLAAGLVAVPVGAVLAIPAIRLSGLFLALATFGFAVLVQQMFYTQPFMFGSNALGLGEPRPHVLGLATDTGFYYLVLLIAVAATVLVLALNRSRLGRLLQAMADSPTVLETSGTDVRVSNVIVFCVSAFLAAIGGALAGAAQTIVIADSFPPLLSLNFFALIIIVWGRAPWDAVLAGLSLIVFPAYMPSSETATLILQLVFGASAILVSVTPPHRLPHWARRGIDRLFRRTRAPARKPEAAPAARARAVEGIDIALEGVTVRYGGLVAVKNLSLRMSGGSITGLIGPNGAGKTTAFNAVSGFVRPDAGRILIGDRDVTRLGPSARARLGLGRTFQRMELLDSLTVFDNVAIGVEAGLAGANPITHVLERAGDRRRISHDAQAALDLCGLESFAQAPVATLSTGQRRLVDLARCIAGDSRFLLLDEPSSGLDNLETRRLGAILRTIVAERRVGILLVEHDMSLVLEVSSRISVLDFGTLVFEGTPPEVAVAEIVRAVYLGDARLEASLDDRKAAAAL